MLQQLIKTMSPDILAKIVQNNPSLMPTILTKFEAFVAFSQALTNEQQLYISANLDKLAGFFKDNEVKEAISIVAEAFIAKTKK